MSDVLRGELSIPAGDADLGRRDDDALLSAKWVLRTFSNGSTTEPAAIASLLRSEGVAC